MITIIIVNWNSGQYLRQCIESISLISGQFINKIIVVDNASKDESIRDIEKFNNVKLINAGFNLGFGRACNLGAREASNSKYLLFLNPDATLSVDVLAKTMDYMEGPNAAHIGICGVQLIDAVGHISRSCSRFPSAGIFTAHSLGINKILPGLGQPMMEWDHLTTREVDQVIGAFFLVRKNVFDQLNGFDERFFVYFEEVDFSYRACQKGWLTTYLAEAQAFHVGGGVSSQVKAHRLFYLLRSRLLYALKFFTPFSILITFFFTVFIEPVSRLTLVFRSFSFVKIKEVVIAYGLLYHWLAISIFKKHKR